MDDHILTRKKVLKMLKLSVLVPVFNEESTIIEILERVNLQKIEGVEIETIVVDDGSKDNTISLLKANPNLYQKLVELPKNLGKGGAVIAGLAVTSGEYILFQDADLEYDPVDFKKFEKIFLDFDADGIIGSRFVYSNYTRSHNILNKIGNTILTFIFNLLYNTTFTDIYSCYFAFKKDLLNVHELRTEGFEQHAEILCKVIKKGNKFYEVSISYNGRNASEGKKIKPHHFFLVLFQIIRGRFI